MNIDQPLAQLAEEVQRRRGTIDELAVRARPGEGPFQQKLLVFARLQSILIQELSQRNLEPGNVKHCLDGAIVAATANERAVSPLAENQVERANQDRFAGSGFAGNNVETGL